MLVAEKELPDKLFFKIGEVSKIVGVEPHVLRYWENEFSALRPMKTRGYHRVYRRRDVELAMLIRRLVQQEGFTIAGARKRLRELGKDSVRSEPDPVASHEVALRADLLAIRGELSELIKELDAIKEKSRYERVKTATVTAAIPSTVQVYTHSKQK
ncbi:MAG: MerR family transcriptional regulator [Deltaproteobacteria bacterium]|nr:MerR family transcriptional regulator [Deltaproteobacteria bacterium]